MLRRKEKLFHCFTVGVSSNWKAHLLNWFACVAVQYVTAGITTIRWKIQPFDRELKSAKIESSQNGVQNCIALTWISRTLFSVQTHRPGPAQLYVSDRITEVPSPSIVRHRQLTEAIAHGAQLLAIVQSHSLWFLSCTKGMVLPRK